MDLPEYICQHNERHTPLECLEERLTNSIDAQNTNNQIFKDEIQNLKNDIEALRKSALLTTITISSLIVNLNLIFYILLK